MKMLYAVAVLAQHRRLGSHLIAALLARRPSRSWARPWYRPDGARERQTSGPPRLTGQGFMAQNSAHAGRGGKRCRTGKRPG